MDNIQKTQSIPDLDILWYSLQCSINGHDSNSLPLYHTISLATKLEICGFQIIAFMP